MEGDQASGFLWARVGGSGLERARNRMGAENLSSGPFSPDQVSAPHARVYIALGNKL